MSGLVTGREIVQAARDENVPFMGASIAYYAIASIVPLLALLLAALSTFGGTVTLLELLRTVLSENGQVILTELLENTRGHGATGTLSLVLVVWSGSKVFRGLSVAFTEVYGEVSDISLPAQLVRSAVVMGVLLGALLLFVTASVLV
ncbi:virulence factor BrkB [Haloarcula quadrata]|uniref:Virulence factor BrkB n=1 Tax=Haloarcula quadrata TaxID=182779 RepID=A0A495R3P0_9EURY|nr:YhjD/YihY/BrkB family envelope integrity protein [Haloarcula quadrata]RKS81820.1 virulence factor BrkB [Haloarcula quadrata]